MTRLHRSERRDRTRRISFGAIIALAFDYRIAAKVKLAEANEAHQPRQREPDRGRHGILRAMTRRLACRFHIAFTIHAFLVGCARGAPEETFASYAENENRASYTALALTRFRRLLPSSTASAPVSLVLAVGDLDAPSIVMLQRVLVGCQMDPSTCDTATEAFLSAHAGPRERLYVR